MGNTPSVQPDEQRGQHRQGLDSNHHLFKRGHHLPDIEKSRQDSITSQLFPSRNTRHVAAASTTTTSARKNYRPHTSSMFKTNYSMDDGKTRNEDTASASASGSTENIRDNMAGLSLKASNESVMTPSFLSPGPSTPTVQPTKQAAIPADDLNNRLLNKIGERTTEQEHRFQNRPSVVALKKTLQENSDMNSLNSYSSSGTNTRSSSLDIYGALNIKSPSKSHHFQPQTVNHKNTLAPSDLGNGVSDIDDISDDGYLQSEDVVLNQSLLNNVLKRDMKRKRTKNTNNKNINTNTTTNTSSEIKSKLSNNAYSYESLDNSTLPEVKKLKSLSNDGLPSFHPTAPSVNQSNEISHSQPGHHLGNVNFDRIDSFEKGSVEHREIENGGATLLNYSSMSPSNSSTSSSNDFEKVHVILKWRDPIENPSATKITIISPDIASALNFSPSDKSFHGTFAMKYDENEKSWSVPNLLLPPGIYKFQFIINGEVRHSNFLPTATDSVGNIVNWFEVLPGYETVEPYRDEIDTNHSTDIANTNAHNSNNNKNNNNHNCHTSQGTLIAEPVPGRAGRPPLTAHHTSSYSNKPEKSGTPFSDYAGISRSGSAIRKSPLNQLTSSSVDLLTALKPKVYQYSNEIPELFKAGNMTATKEENDENQPFAPPPPPAQQPNEPPPYDQPSFTSRVVDCNQDNLFANLQQGGLLDAETAEQLFLDKYTVPDLPVYLNSTYLNKIFNEFQKHNSIGGDSTGVNHIIPHVNLNHLLTSSIRDEMISVGCTTRYEGKFITQVIYAPCYYASGSTGNDTKK